MIWRRFGELPAAGVGDTIAIAGFAGFILYCVARPVGGWAMFAAAMFPGPVSTLAHDAFGWSRETVSLALLPLSALFVALEDSEDDDGVSSTDGRRTAGPGRDRADVA